MVEFFKEAKWEKIKIEWRILVIKWYKQPLPFSLAAGFRTSSKENSNTQYKTEVVPISGIIDLVDIYSIIKKTNNKGKK